MGATKFNGGDKISKRGDEIIYVAIRSRERKFRPSERKVYFGNLSAISFGISPGQFPSMRVKLRLAFGSERWSYQRRHSSD